MSINVSGYAFQVKLNRPCEQAIEQATAALKAEGFGVLTEIDVKATAAARRRYQRIAPLYDWMEALPNKAYTPWRKRLWALVEGPRVLEVGVGTGKNMDFYPPALATAHPPAITAIDLTPGMLARAQKKAWALGLNVDLRLGDVQALEFPDAAFDTVVATFVFCSVPDPVLGLREVRRVLQPGGQLLLLEHVRSEGPIAGALMDLLDPLALHTMGPHINRRTVEHVCQAGFTVERVEDLAGDIFKLIVARP